MPADNRTITILVLGDELVGKSSLISTFVSRYFTPNGVPGLMTRVQLPRDDSLCATTIVDSQQGDAALTVTPPRVDSIVLVYDLCRTDTFTRLEKHWLPLLERAYQGKIPVIVAENKYDLYVQAAASVAPTPGSEAGVSRFHRSPSEDALLQRKRQQIVAMMQRFPFVRQSIKCSAKDFLRVDDVFLKAQQAVLFPFTPLYDLQKGRMSLQLERALIRMFRMYDLDQDGLLSDVELERFQRQVVFLDYELVTWKKIVSRHNDPPLPSPVLSPDGKFTVTGFLVIFDVCINQNRLDKVWEALRAFGYDDELRLVMNDGHMAQTVEKNIGRDMSRRPKSSSWKLSGSERRFLVSLFQQFASQLTPQQEITDEGNKKESMLQLTAQDMTRLFAIVEPPLPPWSPQRALTLFQSSWAQPKQYAAPSVKDDSSPASSSLSDEQTQHHQNPPLSPTPHPLSSSGVSILSASDSLPSVGSIAAATSSSSTSLTQKPMDLTEWMGHWHLLAATSPLVTKQELFRLGYVDHHHRARKGGPGSAGKLPYRSQEIRVLVVGNSNKTKVLHSICSLEPPVGGMGSPSSSVGSSLASTTTHSAAVDVSSPESSQTHVRLKRNRSKHRRSTASSQSRSDEIVTHFVFINVPESSVPDVFVNASTSNGYDMVALVFDVTDIATLEYCQNLERKYLRDDMPRVYVAANLDKLDEKDPSKTSVIRAATQHCTASELEGQPLLFSLSALTAESPPEGSERSAREIFLEVLARSYLRREPGIVGLQSSPYDAQKRRRDQLVKGIGLGFLVVIGVGICSLALFKSWFFTASPATPTTSRKK